VTTGCG